MPVRRNCDTALIEVKRAGQPTITMSLSKAWGMLLHYFLISSFNLIFIIVVVVVVVAVVVVVVIFYFSSFYFL